MRFVGKPPRIRGYSRFPTDFRAFPPKTRAEANKISLAEETSAARRRRIEVDDSLKLTIAKVNTKIFDTFPIFCPISPHLGTAQHAYHINTQFKSIICTEPPEIRVFFSISSPRFADA